MLRTATRFSGLWPLLAEQVHFQALCWRPQQNNALFIDAGAHDPHAQASLKGMHLQLHPQAPLPKRRWLQRKTPVVRARPGWLPFHDHVYDSAWAGLVLPWQDVAALVQELSRCLQKEAPLFLCCLGSESFTPYGHLEHFPTAENLLTQAQALKLQECVVHTFERVITYDSALALEQDLAAFTLTKKTAIPEGRFSIPFQILTLHARMPRFSDPLPSSKLLWKGKAQTHEKGQPLS